VAGWVVILNGAQKGEDFRLHEGKNTVGKATGSDITLHDPAVSAMHASISYKDGKFVITDLDSTNGTFINNDSDPLARVELRDNDIIRVGETSLKFKCL
jgi:pSer/pThr/pTyr-binding forkhead associated (FHA) protein